MGWLRWFRNPGRKDLGLLVLRSMGDYREAMNRRSRELARRVRYEHSLVTDDLTFEVPGWCHICSDESVFSVGHEYSYVLNGERVPNWREHLRCSRCGLNNRMRATVHLLEVVAGLQPDVRIYVTEQVTPLYRELKDRFPNLIGSEFLRDGTKSGATNSEGVRHEDVTALTFSDGSLDAVLSFDVFEHVPGFTRALKECARVLAPGGLVFFSVPFLADREDTIVRAEVDDSGEIVHHLPPEYHGDPLTDEGCLAFYHFGWDILESLRDSGFDDVIALSYWSAKYGYLGPHQIMFSARKPR